MAHVNAALTPKHRLRLARLVVEDGWPPARAAEFFNVSWRKVVLEAEDEIGSRVAGRQVAVSGGGPDMCRRLWRRQQGQDERAQQDRAHSDKGSHGRLRLCRSETP